MSAPAVAIKGELNTGPLMSPLRYPGGKAKIAPWIVSQLPPHDVYIEPFFGGGSVLFAKPPARVEVVNDLSERVVNLFRVLREHPDELACLVALTPYSRAEYRESDEITGDSLEDARRFLVRVWMAHGGKLGGKTGWRQGWAGGSGPQRGSSGRVWSRLPERIGPVAQRLAGAIVDCRPAISVLADWKIEDALVYADPPYPRGASPVARGRMYEHEMTDDEHRGLLDALDAHPGPVVLSGYRCALYDDRLRHWARVDRDCRAYRSAKRTESLWLNPVAAATARQRPIWESGQ